MNYLMIHHYVKTISVNQFMNHLLMLTNRIITEEKWTNWLGFCIRWAKVSVPSGVGVTITATESINQVIQFIQKKD